MGGSDWLMTVTLLMFVVAGIAKAVMDVLQFKFHKSIFSNQDRFKQSFFNPVISWKNKWKFSRNSFVRQEKFWGSTTTFVFLTDAWHLAQFIFLNSLFVGMALLSQIDINQRPVLYAIGLGLGWSLLFRGVFSVFYNKTLIQRRWRE